MRSSRAKEIGDCAVDQHDETVTDRHGVSYVVGDENDADAALLSLFHQNENLGGLLHAERRGRFVQNQHLGAEVHRLGDRENLALATRHRAHELVAVPDPRYAEAANLLQRDAVREFQVEELEGPETLARFSPQEEVAADAHQGDRREILMHRGDAGSPRVARRDEADRLTLNQ